MKTEYELWNDERDGKLHWKYRVSAWIVQHIGGMVLAIIFLTGCAVALIGRI